MSLAEKCVQSDDVDVVVGKTFWPKTKKGTKSPFWPKRKNFGTSLFYPVFLLMKNLGTS